MFCKKKYEINIFKVIIYAFILYGCTNNKINKINESITYNKKLFVYGETKQVPEQINIKSLKYKNTLCEEIITLIEKMTSSVNFLKKDILIIENMQNDINNFEKTSQIKKQIKKILKNKINLINKDQLKKAKNKLGILPNDSFNTINKKIDFARYLKVKYILFFNIKKQHPLLSIQLILANNGEIIWSSEE